MDIWDLKNKAEEYRKVGKYREVIDIYAEIALEETALLNEGDLWRIAFSLRKLGEIEEAVKLYRGFYESNTGAFYNNNLYAWCLYDCYINRSFREIKNNEGEFDEAAAIITKVTKQESYSAYEPTVKKVIEYYKSKPSTTEEFINEWLDKLN